MIICVNQGQRELVVKRSRFIAISRHIETRDDVKPIIDEIKAEHSLARHVCYGYIADEKAGKFISGGFIYYDGPGQLEDLLESLDSEGEKMNMGGIHSC